MAVWLKEELSQLALLDQHCHPVTAEVLDDDAFVMWATESRLPAPPGVSYLDSQLGGAIRRWCGPALGLPADASMVDYLTARRELSADEVNNRLLRGANLRGLLVDTGLTGKALLSPSGLADAADAPTGEIVRLESLAERIADATTASWFPDAFTAALGDALAGPAASGPAGRATPGPSTAGPATAEPGGMTADASVGVVAVKSVAAYRYGLDLDPIRPTNAEVVEAAGEWLGQREGQEDRCRLTHPVLLRFLLWSAVDTGRPLQVHTGFGDADGLIRGSDPSLLQPFCAATQASGTPIVLLHTYPYHRQAGWLAHLYPHVYVDCGPIVGYLGARSAMVLGEYLELAPFGKVLYSSDAYGLAELFLVGAAQFRHSLGRVLSEFVDDGAMTETDALRIAAGVAAGNASRVYQLGDDQP